MGRLIPSCLIIAIIFVIGGESCFDGVREYSPSLVFKIAAGEQFPQLNDSCCSDDQLFFLPG
jgi:hypothetical protein